MKRYYFITLAEKKAQYEAAKAEYLATHVPTISLLAANDGSDEEMA